jgi:hypothetical protein
MLDLACCLEALAIEGFRKLQIALVEGDLRDGVRGERDPDRVADATVEIQRFLGQDARPLWVGADRAEPL